MTETMTLLPHALPAGAGARIALFAIRRMGAHGLADARAAHVIFTTFGQRFRRPLILTRTLMAELASTAEFGSCLFSGLAVMLQMLLGRSCHRSSLIIQNFSSRTRCSSGRGVMLPTPLLVKSTGDAARMAARSLVRLFYVGKA